MDYFSSERREMLPFVPTRRGRVLEIGCGEGRFSGSLTGVNESWGIEPSLAFEAAKSRLSRVIHATFDEAESELPLSYFDVVICNDVIEHMVNHAEFLRKIGKYISPGGMIIGSIPNVRFYKNMFEYFLEKDWNYTDSGILDRTHLSFFTEKSFRKTLNRHGFNIIQLKGINTGCKLSNSMRNEIYFYGAYCLVFLTLGYFSDIRHLQFAFQATPR